MSEEASIAATSVALSRRAALDPGAAASSCMVRMRVPSHAPGSGCEEYRAKNGVPSRRHSISRSNVTWSDPSGGCSSLHSACGIALPSGRV